MHIEPIIQPAQTACESCSVYRAAHLKKLGVSMANWDYVRWL